VGDYTNIQARYTDVPLSDRQILQNRVMSSGREVIEWDYGDLKSQFAFLDYKKVLKMRKMPVAYIFLCALLLRNAHVCMNGCRTSEFFLCAPPTFEEWIASGPRYYEMPTTFPLDANELT
jgi:hypothetical protein